MKNKKKIIICGATGFIGRNTLLYFSKKKEYEVFATYNIRKKITIKNVTWIKVNLIISGLKTTIVWSPRSGLLIKLGEKK